MYASTLYNTQLHSVHFPVRVNVPTQACGHPRKTPGTSGVRPGEHPPGGVGQSNWDYPRVSGVVGGAPEGAKRDRSHTIATTVRVRP